MGGCISTLGHDFVQSRTAIQNDSAEKIIMTFAIDRAVKNALVFEIPQILKNQFLKYTK